MLITGTLAFSKNLYPHYNMPFPNGGNLDLSKFKKVANNYSSEIS